MYQQVNLYQPTFRRQPKVLSTTTLATIVAIVTGLMLAGYLDARSTLQGLRRTSANLALNQVQLDARLDQIASAAVASATTDLEDDLATLRSRIADRNALLHRVDDLFIGAGAGFGDVFEALARTSLPGLWLSEIRLGEDGSIRISGSASDPAQVARYLREVARQPSLASLFDGTVDIERDDARPSTVDFVLSYATDGAGR